MVGYENGAVFRQRHTVEAGMDGERTMEDQRIVVRCTECERVYAAREREEEYLLSTEDGNCRCGNGTLEAIATRPVAT